MAEHSEAYRRFRASMAIDYGKWRDGEPYDIAALDGMTQAERDEIAEELSGKSQLDWRDVEALKRIATPRATARVKRAAADQTDGGGVEAFADDVAEGWSKAIERRFIAKLTAARLMESSTDRLYEIAQAHPTPGVRAALFRLATTGDESMRYSYGAGLLYITGQAEDSYGLSDDHRPHLLDLNGDDAERAAAAAWLKAKTGAA